MVGVRHVIGLVVKTMSLIIPSSQKSGVDVALGGSVTSSLLILERHQKGLFEVRPSVARVVKA